MGEGFKRVRRVSGKAQRLSCPTNFRLAASESRVAFCKLHGKVNSFTTRYISRARRTPSRYVFFSYCTSSLVLSPGASSSHSAAADPRHQAHMTISDHKKLVENRETSRKRPIPILADTTGVNAVRASSENTHEDF